MDKTEVIPGNGQSARRFQVAQSLRESVRKPCQSSYLRPSRERLPLEPKRAVTGTATTANDLESTWSCWKRLMSGSPLAAMQAVRPEGIWPHGRFCLRARGTPEAYANASAQSQILTRWSSFPVLDLGGAFDASESDDPGAWVGLPERREGVEAFHCSRDPYGMNVTFRPFCPLCGSNQFHRSRRRGIWERLFLRVFNFHAYRCERCDSRFFSKTKHAPVAVED
jgi:hypothetical protein